MGKQRSLLVCTHGRFGEELIRSCEMITGCLSDVYSFSLLPGMPPEDYREMVEEKLKTLTGDVVCLVDLFGGTPCNSVAILSKKYDMHILSGVNLAMIIEMVTQKDQLEMDEWIECGLTTLIQSGKDVIKFMKSR